MKDRILQFKDNLADKWQELWTKQVMQSQLIQQGAGWYNNQNSRDQLLIKLLTVFVLVSLVVVLFYVPLLKSKSMNQAALERNIATYNLIASNASKFGGAQAGSNSATGSVLAAVTSQARSQNINLSRYEQDGANLRVWLDRAVFDDAITWLETLENTHGISVTQITIDKTNSVGRVDIRATLAR